MGPLGLNGLLRVKSLHPEGIEASCLHDAERLWLKKSERQWLELKVRSIEPHGRDLRLACFQIEHRAQAGELVFCELGLDRSELPELNPDETYWVDLIGAEVINQDGASLGRVDRLETNGAHDWIVVGPHWIPFVQAYVQEVSLERREIRVEWDPSWTA